MHPHAFMAFVAGALVGVIGGVFLVRANSKELFNDEVDALRNKLEVLREKASADGKAAFSELIADLEAIREKFIAKFKKA